MRRSPRLLLQSASAPPVVAARAAAAVMASGERGSSLDAAMLAKERACWAKDLRFVVGVDEAGRGPLAGPVVVCACAFDQGVEVAGLDDSKKLSEEERDAAFALLKSTPGVHYAVAVVGPEVIDDINILQATLRGMDDCVAQLKRRGVCSAVLVDGPFLPPACAAADDIALKEAIKGGDAKVRCIAAASVIAKCTRDALMRAEAARFPLYGFDVHKGYPVPAHRDALARHGPCAIHRMSYKPCQDAAAAHGVPLQVKKKSRKQI